MKSLSKLEECLNGPYEKQQYFKELTVNDIRMKFRIRTKMVPAKFNYKTIFWKYTCSYMEDFAITQHFF